MKRRTLLKAGLGLLAVAGCATEVVTGPNAFPPAPVPPAPNLFPQPPQRVSSNGLLSTTLDVRAATNRIGDRTVTTRTYEGMLAPPTLRVRPGDTLQIRLSNSLPAEPANMHPGDLNVPHGFNTTNLHVHGMHVSPLANSDNVFLEIPPGEAFNYEYRIPANHPEGTYWYHPHKHGSTAVQLVSSMGGALIVAGDLDGQFAQYRDLVFLITELNVDAAGNVPDFMTNGVFLLQQRILGVNGQFKPTLAVRPGEVIRLRVINATMRTEIPFFLDGHDLNAVAVDGLTLPAPVPNPISLAPANRVDYLIRAGAPGIYSFRKGVGTSTANPDPEVVLATFEVSGDPLSMEIPTALDVPDFIRPIADAEVTGNRTLTFNVAPGGPGTPQQGFPNFTIDGARFDANVVNHTVALNAVEQWTLRNPSFVGHPFHIHINPFQVMSINGVPRPHVDWRDTVDIPARGEVVMRSRFLDFTGRYVLHCHILTHEDLGMMQIVEVV